MSRVNYYRVNKLLPSLLDSVRLYDPNYDNLASFRYLLDCYKWCRKHVADDSLHKSLVKSAYKQWIIMYFGNNKLDLEWWMYDFEQFFLKLS